MERHFIELENVVGGPRRLSWLETGRADSGRTVLCVHGLTRNALDFERFAEAIAPHARVLAVDVAGRGQSDRLADSAGYQVPTYVGDIVALLRALDIDAVDWVGTSMGGLIGMATAAAPDAAVRGVVRRLVLNDVGPLIPKAALERIADYVGRVWDFADFDTARDHVRAAYAPFGLSSDADWHRLAEISLRRNQAGRWVQTFDPAIGEVYRGAKLEDVDLWALWDAIACPVLVLRGAESDLLTGAIADEMAARGPGAEVVTFAGIGHAPALMDADQIAPVVRWLGLA